MKKELWFYRLLKKVGLIKTHEVSENSIFVWHETEMPPVNKELLFKRIPKDSKYKTETFVGRYNEYGNVIFPTGGGELFNKDSITYKWAYIPE